MLITQEEQDKLMADIKKEFIKRLKEQVVLSLMRANEERFNWYIGKLTDDLKPQLKV